MRDENYKDFIKKEKQKLQITNEDELKELQQKMLKQENYWKQFKYNEDIAQLHTKFLSRGRKQQHLEKVLLIGGLISIPLGIMLETLCMNMYSSNWKRKRYVMGSFVFLQTLGMGLHWISIENIEKNIGIYSTMPGDVKLQNIYDQKYNLYQSVDDIKYNDQYMSRSEFIALSNQEYAKKQKQLQTIYTRLGL